MSFLDPRAVLDEAREFAKRGRYEEALQRHVWFHEHALEHDPALCGVRVSIALSDWANLGMQYPPACQALLNVRDRTLAAARDGNWPAALVHDLMALNHALCADDENANLFLELHRTDPTLAAQFYRHVEAELIARGLYAVCAAHTLEAMSRFKESQEHRREALQAPEVAHLQPLAAFRAAVDQHFAVEVGKLIAVLVSVGRTDEAEQVRASALAEAESAEARESIARAGF